MSSCLLLVGCLLGGSGGRGLALLLLFSLLQLDGLQGFRFLLLFLGSLSSPLALGLLLLLLLVVLLRFLLGGSRRVIRFVLCTAGSFLLLLYLAQ